MLLKILQLHTVSLSVDCWVENPQGLFKNPSQPKKTQQPLFLLGIQKLSLPVPSCACSHTF